AELGSPFHAVPLPFDPAARIDWTPVWSFRSNSFRYLPTSYCYYGYPSPPDATTSWADSNGCAAGNTLEEAALQGLLELVERDAVAIWWYNRLSRPGVDLESYDEPYVDELRRCYASLGRELWALDITSDLGIPTFAAVSRRIDQPAEDILFGFGAHLDARVALLRALTEMNQFMPAVHGAGSRGPASSTTGPHGYGDRAAVDWWQTATLRNQPYLAPSADIPARRAWDHAPLSSADLRDDVSLCIARAARLGLETLLLDQTLPDVGLRVVKMIVPGMRHFWARFAPGRLYDVPVEMGWLPRPLREDELNPIPMFL
ncbi:MAG TPA: YcaO-like family protein, partial [Candidatus Nanopelagicales bacterium]|nr:YcaO-like family protein [Candidatus Nanopelagicales bacterium]